jgi:hypothetical protein
MHSVSRRDINLASSTCAWFANWGIDRRKLKQRRPQMIPAFFAITVLVLALLLFDFETAREL